jgi:hypothetical protein
VGRGAGPGHMPADLGDDRLGDPPLHPSGTETQAAMLYSWMSPPKTSFLRMPVGLGRDQKEVHRLASEGRALDGTWPRCNAGRRFEGPAPGVFGRG